MRTLAGWVLVRLLLIHSPLVGPATWRRVAEVLTALGHDADVPDLRAAVQTGDPQRFVDAAREATSGDTRAVIGHSGAGFFLPPIAAGRHEPPRLVFVDAGIPPGSGTATASADFLPRLRSLAVDGRLPRWSQWWGAGTMERLVPDRHRRLEFEAELDEVPLELFERSVAIPDGWRDGPAAFVLLSEAYRSDASTAASLGWPTVELPGAHLDVVNHPEAVARAVIALAAGGD